MKKTTKNKSTAKSAKQSVPSTALAKGTIGASVKVLQLGAGLYLASVQTGAPRASTPGLRLPALHVGTVPGMPTDRVELIPNLPANGPWISAPGDLLVIRILAPGAAVVLTSIRAEGGTELAVKLEKLDGSHRTVATPASTTAPPPPIPAIERRTTADGLRVQVGAHIRGRGDMNFADTLWAGKLGKGFWLESFSVTPLQELSSRDVEYKGLTASGFESPWMSEGSSCGTRGMAIPLIGFAIRPKGNATRDYDIEYSGQFQSGVVVGPLRNGTPCRSTMPNDPLEAIQVKVLRRSGTMKSSVKKRPRR